MVRGSTLKIQSLLNLMEKKVDAKKGGKEPSGVSGGERGNEGVSGRTELGVATNETERVDRNISEVRSYKHRSTLKYPMIRNASQAPTAEKVMEFAISRAKYAPMISESTVEEAGPPARHQRGDGGFRR